jgi:hypothetical protein
VVEFLSVLVLTFSATLIVLGIITFWLEHESLRWQGIVIVLLGLLVGLGYTFLGSRFALALFGRLIVRVNLPALMATALLYTIGVLGGISLAFGIFLWATGRYQAWQLRRRVIVLALLAVLLAIALTFLAVWLSHMAV